jgi:hypothetical protein
MVVPFPAGARQENTLFFKTSRSALGPIQTPTEGLVVSVSPGIKRLRQESDHSLHFLPRLRISGAIPPRDICRHEFHGDKLTLLYTVEPRNTKKE